MDAPNETPRGVPPYPLAILLCDDLIVEAGSGKKTLVGLFEQVQVRSFPAAQQLFMYAKFTDAEGTYRLHMEYANVSRNQLLDHQDMGVITVPDRLASADLVVHTLISIPEPGAYEFGSTQTTPISAGRRSRPSRWSRRESNAIAADVSVLEGPTILPPGLTTQAPAYPEPPVLFIHPVVSTAAHATAPLPPATTPSATPPELLLGSLPHPWLRLRAPLRLRVEREGEQVTVWSDDLEELGFGPHLTAAVADFQQTVVELYLTLRQDARAARLGPAMRQLWDTLQQFIELRS